MKLEIFFTRIGQNPAKFCQNFCKSVQKPAFDSSFDEDKVTVAAHLRATLN